MFGLRSRVLRSTGILERHQPYSRYSLADYINRRLVAHSCGCPAYQSLHLKSSSIQSTPTRRSSSNRIPDIYHHEAPSRRRHDRLACSRCPKRSLPSSLRSLGPIWYLHHEADLCEEGRFLRSKRLSVLQRTGHWMLL